MRCGSKIWPAFLKNAALVLWLLLAVGVPGAEVIPPKPARHFNDYAGVTSVEVQQRLDRQLDAFEKSDSTQVIVVIFRKMQSDSSIEDYTIRVAQSWKVGTEAKDNGAVLFIFVEDRKMFLQVGYGLEGAIPDITARDITENRIKPHFRNNDYNGGAIAGVDSIIRAARGEYQGTGKTIAGQEQARQAKRLMILATVIIILFIIASSRRRRGHLYDRSGRHGWGGPIIWPGGGGDRGGSGGWSGGGGGGWGGGFSGGGGSFGGGGAGSSW